MEKVRRTRAVAALLAASAAVSACSGAAPVARRLPDTASSAATATSPSGRSAVARLPDLGAWRPVDAYPVPTLTAGQGLATVVRGDGGTRIVYRGGASLPLRLLMRGWSHVGDPGGHDGYLVDAYQGRQTATAKLFVVTPPTGTTYDVVHRLVRGEAPNNSFAAISPDGRWLVSAEWETVRRLLVFPSPTVRRPARGLQLAGTIALDRPVRDLQGCDFVSSRQLVCASDDPGAPRTLVSSRHQLLQVHLLQRLHGGGATRAHVSALGELPAGRACTGDFEPEGVDYDATTGLLRVEVVSPKPCPDTTVYVYREVG